MKKEAPIKTEKVIRFLKVYNKWRRGSIEEMPDQKEMGIIIDRAIELLDGMLNRNRNGNKRKKSISNELPILRNERQLL